jgi:hypothetical protein
MFCSNYGYILQSGGEYMKSNHVYTDTDQAKSNWAPTLQNLVPPPSEYYDAPVQ